jgi:hypothetical protein
MTTVLIIICIVFCIGVIGAIVGHLGYAITRDQSRHGFIRRYHLTRNPRRRVTT